MRVVGHGPAAQHSSQPMSLADSPHWHDEGVCGREGKNNVRRFNTPQLSTGSSSLTSATTALALTDRYAGPCEHREGPSSVHVSSSVSVAEPAPRF